MKEEDESLPTSNGTEEETPFEREMPEFIVLDDEKTTQEEQLFEKGTLNIDQKALARVPFRLRLLCFLVAVVAALWTGGAIITCFVTSIFSLLFLRTNEILNLLTQKYWSYVCRGAAVTLGLFIAVFSPFLGLSVLVSYLVISDKEAQNGFLSQFLKIYFNDLLRKRK